MYVIELLNDFGEWIKWFSVPTGVLQPIFRTNYGFRVVASHYLANDQLDKVISLFEAYMPRYLDPTYLKQEQKIPFGHLQLMTTVFLKMVT